MGFPQNAQDVIDFITSKERHIRKLTKYSFLIPKNGHSDTLCSFCHLYRESPDGKKICVKKNIPIMNCVAECEDFCNRDGIENKHFFEIIKEKKKE